MQGTSAVIRDAAAGTTGGSRRGALGGGGGGGGVRVVRALTKCTISYKRDVFLKYLTGNDLSRL